MQGGFIYLKKLSAILLNPSIDKAENRALFDNLGNGEVLASKIDKIEF